jgi:hypothetical protein
VNAILASGAIAVCGVLAPSRFTLSLAVGVAIQAVNYRVLRRATNRLFAGELTGGRAWTAAYALRFVGVGVAMVAALAADADPVGLVIGLSTVVPAAVIAAWRHPPPAAPSALALPPDDPSWDRWDAWWAREREVAEEDEG